ncbi:MAG TPA: aldo/keto reductase, partial [Candidatus Limnocylindrales bacterium]
MMRYVEVGGLRLSVIGLGTWQFGSREWAYGATYASDTAPAIVRRAIELGVTLIDTAEIYGFGRSERIVGEAIRGRRDGLVIASKLVPLLPQPSVVGWQVRGSLRRLGVDAIDLYQVHFPNPFVSPRSTMAPMRPLLEDGLVRHVGVSNYSLGRWRAAERGLGHAVLTNQVRFSLATPLPHWELVPYAREQGRVVIAYSPLGQGLLSGSHSLNTAA